MKILSFESSAVSAAADAMAKALEAFNNAGTAQDTADDAQEAAAANAAAIQVTDKKITALAAKVTFDDDGLITNVNKSGLVTTAEMNSLITEKFTFDADGKVTNISTAGLVTEDDFVGLFATRVTAEGLVKQTDISAFITEDEAGNLISNAVIQADKINFIGKTVISGGKFTVDEEGNVSMTNATIAGIVNSKNGYIGAFKINEYGLSNIGDNPLARIEIEKDGGKFFRINTSSRTMCAIRGDGITALGISAFGDNSIGIDVTAQAGDESIAIRSYGDVEMTARPTESLQFKGSHTYIEGMAIKVTNVSADTTLDLSVGWVTCSNQNKIRVYLPLNPPIGKIVYLMRTAKQVDVDGNGIAISFKGSIISVLGITNRAEINFFLYDGTYWMNGWFNGTV